MGVVSGVGDLHTYVLLFLFSKKKKNQAANKSQVRKLELLPAVTGQRFHTGKPPFYRQHLRIPLLPSLNNPYYIPPYPIQSYVPQISSHWNNPSNPDIYSQPVKSTSQTLLYANPSPKIPSYSYPSQSQTPYAYPIWLHAPKMLVTSPGLQPSFAELNSAFFIPESSSLHFLFLAPSCIPISPCPLYQKFSQFDPFYTLSPKRNLPSSPYIISLVPTLSTWIRSQTFCIW